MTGPRGADLAGIRVLVVDDSEDSALSLAALLRRRGCLAEVVYRGEAVLEAARALRADVVILDLGLPDVDGFEVARRIRSDPELAGTILVALTGHGGEEARRRCVEAGFDRHVLKPVGVTELAPLLLERRPRRASRP